MWARIVGACHLQPMAVQPVEVTTENVVSEADQKIQVVAADTIGPQIVLEESRKRKFIEDGASEVVLPEEKRLKVDEKVATVVGQTNVLPVAVEKKFNFEEARNDLLSLFEGYRLTFGEAPGTNGWSWGIVPFAMLRQMATNGMVKSSTEQVFNNCRLALEEAKEKEDLIAVLHKNFHLMWKAQNSGEMSVGRQEVVTQAMQMARENSDLFGAPISEEEEKGIVPEEIKMAVALKKEANKV